MMKTNENVATACNTIRLLTVVECMVHSIYAKLEKMNSDTSQNWNVVSKVDMRSYDRCRNKYWYHPVVQSKHCQRARYSECRECWEIHWY